MEFVKPQLFGLKHLQKRKHTHSCGSFANYGVRVQFNTKQCAETQSVWISHQELRVQFEAARAAARLHQGGCLQKTSWRDIDIRVPSLM